MTRDPGSRELAESTSCGPATHDDAQEDRGYGEHEQNVDYAPHEVKRKAEHPQDEEAGPQPSTEYSTLPYLASTPRHA